MLALQHEAVLEERRRFLEGRVEIQFHDALAKRLSLDVMGEE